MRSVVLLGVLGAVSSALLAGCGGNSCEDAIGNAAKLYGIGGSSYGAQRAKAIQTCKDEKWSEQLRACAVAAKTKPELDACEKYKRDEAPSGAAEYAQKSKRIEAEVNLERIKRSLKAHYMEMAMFPTGSASLTPAAPCCDGPNHRCPPNPSDWAGNPVWDALDFEVSDPAYFQYAYESKDGKSAVARAVGDLDCDMVTVTFEMRCEAPAGDVVCTLTKPDRPD